MDMGVGEEVGADSPTHVDADSPSHEDAAKDDEPLRRERLLLRLNDEFTCPITHERMRDPVVLSDGHTYERSAAMQVLQLPNPISPITREA